MRNVSFYPLALSIIILIAACEPTPTATVLADCAWDGTAVAWLDANSNGAWDDNEFPLTNVEFYVDGWTDWYIDNAFVSKDVPTGGVGIVVWLAGCPDVSFQVYVEAPENYRLTTDICIVPNQNYGEILQFGLNY